ERLRVIGRLRDHVERNALEKVLQKLLFENLWLLDPAWERATQTEYMEKTVTSALKKEVPLSEDEVTARIDIGYREVAGTHVIVELKRAERVMESGELVTQVRKYRSAARKVLEKELGAANTRISVVVVVGRALRDWEDLRTRGESDD